jgi:hypothetical protein
MREVARFPLLMRLPAVRGAGARFCAAIVLLAVAPRAPQAQWVTAWKIADVSGSLDSVQTQFLIEQLEESSRWLASLGFKKPTLDDNPDFAGVERITGYYDSNKTGTCGNVAALYDSDEKIYFSSGLFRPGAVVIDPASLSDPSRPVSLDEGYLLSPVHEIFHAVQTSHLSWTERTGNLKWFDESSAEAIRYAWGEHKYGSIDLHERRSYDEPLHEPFIAVGCGANSEIYRTGHFWYHLGGDISSRDRVAYLETILKTLASPTADLSRGGIKAIAEALKNVDGGLYNLYPQFIARHATDTLHYRYEQRVQLTPANPQVIDHTKELKPARELAAAAWLLTVKPQKGRKTGLTIQLTDDHPDLHLIVDTTRLDVPPPRRERNVFRTTIQTHQDSVQFLVRVANVAQDAGQSQDRPYAIEFRLGEVTPCDPVQLWAAVHPSAQVYLTPPQQYLQQLGTGPGNEPGESELNIQGLITDGGTSCANPVSVSSNPSAPDLNMGSRLQQQVSQMTPQEMQAMAMRMAARMQPGKNPTADDIVNALRAEPMVDSTVKMSSMIQVFSPNAVFWQRGSQPSFNPAQIANYAADKPIVAWNHAGLGGWQPHSGSQAFIIVQDVAPEALREDTTYAAVAAMQYSRGEGVMKTSRSGSGTTPQSSDDWQGLEGWIELVSNDANVEPYSLKGTVTIERITGISIEGTFSLTGMGEFERAECPKSATNLPFISQKCKFEKRMGALSITGRFVAPAASVSQP